MIYAALTLALVGQTSEMRLMRNADIYGDTIVFNYAGDLWSVGKSGGNARRLTSHPMNETLPRYSPDGKWISFTASYDGNADIFVMPAEGGQPRRVTWDGDADLNLDWTPDGKIAYASNRGCHSNRFNRLWIVSPNGGMPIHTNLQEVSDLSFSADSENLVFNRENSHQFNWRRYRGGTQGVIEFFNLKTNAWSAIPHARENSWQPMWVGNNIFYISDKNQGTRNLYCYDVNSKKITQLTQYSDEDIKNPQTDGKTIVWEHDGYLETFDLASKAVNRVNCSVPSDFLAARPRWSNVSGSIAGLGLSPSGVRVVADARGDVYSIPARSGDTRNVTETQGVRETNPDWSPDGQLISYLSDEGGEVALYTRPQMGGAATKHKVDPQIVGYQWSHDSKTVYYTTRDGKIMIHDLATGNETLVYQTKWQATLNFDVTADGSWMTFSAPSDNLQGSIFLYNVAEKKLAKVTDGFYSDDQVTFDRNGKYLYVISNRTFYPNPGAFEFMMNMGAPQRAYLITLRKDIPNPMITGSDEEPVKSTGGGDDEEEQPKPPAGERPKGTQIDLDGIGDRILPLPFQPGEPQGVIGVNNGVVVYTGEALVYFSVQARQGIPVYEGPIGGLGLNASRTKVVINTGQGLVTMPLAPGGSQQIAPVNTRGVEMMWDPKAEWKQIFWESWRWERDIYYDPNMLGLDWKAIGDHYAQYLPYVQHRNDLNYILGLMIGELGTGHAYVGGGDIGQGTPPVPVGALGCEYGVSNGHVTFNKIYKGKPYSEAERCPLTDVGINVKEGEYLIAIDGKEVSATTDPAELLVGKVGRTVNLTVNGAPTATGSRVVRVRPIADETALRYATWVDENRKRVDAMSGGRIGYIHVPDTSVPGVQEFIRGFYSQTNKDAWIIDERYNGGGQIPTFFVEFLKREIVAKMKARGFNDVAFPTGNLTGPKAMLINEYAGSGGDMLPWLFKEEKVGPLIGRRTWGGLVGIAGSAPLIDGGFLTSPGFGIYDPHNGQWIAENKGIDPDIEVDARPDLVAQGKDPQLEKGVEYLLGEIKRGGKPNKEPQFPKVGP